MAFVRFPVVGNITLKDIYRNKVLNGTFDVTLDMTPNTTRITVNEGGYIGIDTTNRIGYFYVDFTTLVASVSNDWRTLGNFPSTMASYLPKLASNSRVTQVAMITDELSDSHPCCFVGSPSSSYLYRFGSGYAEQFSIGDRIIVYGSWTY